MDISWICLIAASILEPIWVITLEKSNGFKKAGWSAATIISVFACLVLLALAVQGIGPGVSYAILAGIGTVGALAAGVILYKEKVTPKKITFMMMILVGVIGIRLVSGGVI